MERFSAFLLEKLFERGAFLGRRVAGTGGSVSETFSAQPGARRMNELQIQVCSPSSGVGRTLQTQATPDARACACPTMGAPTLPGALQRQALGRQVPPICTCPQMFRAAQRWKHANACPQMDEVWSTRATE